MSPSAHLLVPVVWLLILLAALALAFYAIHRLLRRAPNPASPELSGAAQVPFPALEQMVLQIKRQDEELQRLRRELRRRDQDGMRVSREVLSHLPSGVIFFDRLGRVQEANPAARGALGFASPQGLRASELFRDAVVREPDGEPLGTATELLHQALAGGAPRQRKELDYVTPGGQRRTLGITISPLPRPTAALDSTPGAGLEGLICLLTDLTAIRALEEELRRRQNLASLGEMAAGIAHEFKNALATISGYAQMLHGLAVGSPAPLVPSDRDAELRAYTTKIVEQVAELTEMTGEFLTFARPLDARLEPLALAESLAEGVRSFGASEFEGVQIEQAGEAPLILGDRLLLNRVWINLLRNAGEAIAQAGGGGNVRIEVASVGDEARVRVTDSGPGIAGEVAEKIFIPFFTTKPTGSGLGLAIVHKIVAAHHGAVVLEDRSPGRTTFAVTLPLAAAGSAGVAATASEEAVAKRPERSGAGILPARFGGKTAIRAGKSARPTHCP